MILSAIVRGSLRHPVMVTLVALLLLAYGALTVANARYDVFPEFVPAQASVQTEAPGLAPEQVEALVTRPLETSISGTNSIASVRSQSIQGLSVIDVVFEAGTDPYRDRQVLAEAVSGATARLPANVGVPALSALTSSTMDLLKIGFTSDRLSPMALRDLVQWTVRPRLLAVPGVARAVVFGGDERRLNVELHPTAMVARGVTAADVTTAIQSAATVRGGGFADTPSQRILVAPESGASTPETLAMTPVPSGAASPASTVIATPLRIGDVASVRYAATPKSGDALIMGKRGVLIALSSQYGANTLETTLAVEAALAELRPALASQGVTLAPRLHRPANFIETALSGVERDLLIGAALIGFVLFAFLRNIRAALITFLAIPLSLLAALIVLDRMGQTINTMTLGGLTVALGVVIDDAIVDVENILRRLRLNPDGPRAETIAAASIEVRAPVVYATFVLAFTIAPILALTGLQGAFFSPLALSFLLATMASLLVAMSVTPALSLLMLGKLDEHHEPRLITAIKARHARLVARVCDAPGAVIAATALIGVAALLAALSFGGELLPAFRERHYVIQVSGPSGASIDYMRDVGRRISRDLLALPAIASVEQQIGRAEAGEDTFPPHRSEFHVELNDVSAAGEEQTLTDIRAVLDRYPGLSSETLTFLGDRIRESLSGETAAVAIGVYGGDLDTLDRVANAIAARLKRLPDAADVQVKSPSGAPKLTVRLDPRGLALHGVSASDAADSIEIAFQGRVVAQSASADRTTDIALTLDSAGRDPESVGDLLVRSADGTTARLADVADIRPSDGRLAINHDEGRRRQVVTVNPIGSDVIGFVATARAAIARDVPLPPGVYLGYSGLAEGQAAATRQLAINVAAAAIAVAALLVLAFGGPRPALLIAAGTPFALAGGVIAAWLTGGVLSLGALVGFVTLFGIAARNAILLISHVDHLVEAEGEPFGLTTVLRATRERVTPILMTALVTALGLAPLALEAGQSGREVQGPMAVVILGGLVTSTLMSLALLPALVLAWRQKRQ